MDPLTSMVEQHIWMTREMIERVARLTDDQLDAPLGFSADDDGKTLRRLLSRLIGQLDLWNHAIAGETYDFAVEQYEDVAAMRERFAEAAPRFLAQVDEVVSEGRLGETFVNTVRGQAKVFTYGAMIQHVLTFAAHNRTLVIMSLKKAGINDLNLCIAENTALLCVDDRAHTTVHGYRHRQA